MYLISIHFLYLLFCLMLLQNLVGGDAFLECFFCDGSCNCQNGQIQQKCDSKNAYCYAVKSAFTGQVLRKGCSAAGCKSVPLNGAWQRCHHCGDKLCNNDEGFWEDKITLNISTSNFLLDECQLHQFFGTVQTLRNNLRRESGVESETSRGSQFVNGIDSSSFSPSYAHTQKPEFKNEVGTFLERMSPMDNPIGLEKDNIHPQEQLTPETQLHQIFGQNLVPKTPNFDDFATGPRVTFGQEILRQNNGATSILSIASKVPAMIALFFLLTLF